MACNIQIDCRASASPFSHQPTAATANMPLSPAFRDDTWREMRMCPGNKSKKGVDSPKKILYYFISTI